ncbi:hypothetical protein PR048_031455 [Dryococelus australis]|uniref:Uncharacterized protein n=1 Tax=Dryococelus australis TaxID=614101 RepID=A0ABQ9G5B9_9NEOP|nr:hypothetical protein PR048_031455 [Dryococelus australis]
MVHPWNAMVGETGDPRENPPTSGTVRHDSHMRESEGDPAGYRTLASNYSDRCVVISERRANTVTSEISLRAPGEQRVRLAGRTMRNLEVDARLEAFGEILVYCNAFSTCMWSINGVRGKREGERERGGGSGYWTGGERSHITNTSSCSVPGEDCPRRIWSSAGMKGREKLDIPEKTRRPTASSGTIPTCENPVTRPGIEPGSPWWEASVLTARPPRSPGKK